MPDMQYYDISKVRTLLNDTVSITRMKKFTRKRVTKKKLKNRKASYFRKSASYTFNRRNRSTVEYIIRRTLESLPEYLRKYLEEDKESIITNLTQQVMVLGKDNEFNPFATLAQMAVRQRRRGKEGTKDELWEILRIHHRDIYNEYNDYMRGAGYAPKRYFYDNIETSAQGSNISGYLELPGFEHKELEITYNYSADASNAVMY